MLWPTSTLTEKLFTITRGKYPSIGMWFVSFHAGIASGMIFKVEGRIGYMKLDATKGKADDNDRRP